MNFRSVQAGRVHASKQVCWSMACAGWQYFLVGVLLQFIVVLSTYQSLPWCLLILGALPFLFFCNCFWTVALFYLSLFSGLLSIFWYVRPKLFSGASACKQTLFGWLEQHSAGCRKHNSNEYLWIIREVSINVGIMKCSNSILLSKISGAFWV